MEQEKQQNTMFSVVWRSSLVSALVCRKVGRVRISAITLGDSLLSNREEKKRFSEQ
jgi:hypothetical protein